MKSIAIPTVVLDPDTGVVLDFKPTQFNLMPPAPGKCQTCAVEHALEQPHNAQSLFYQYAFYAEHGRWPTWADAIAHCTSEMQAFWKKALLDIGAWKEPDQRPDETTPIEKGLP